MASKIMSGLIAAALVAAPTGAFAQAAPAPAAETISADGVSGLRGGNAALTVGVVFALFVFVIGIWAVDGGDDDNGGTPTTP